MNRILVAFIFLFSQFVFADDIIHASSEDINEFDQLLADEPLNAEDGKNKNPKKKPPRDSFNGKTNKKIKEKKYDRRIRPPRDDRERGRRNPPPKGPGGGPPPPPPPPQN